MRAQFRPIALPLTFVTVLFATWGVASIQGGDVSVESEAVAGPVHMLTGRGGNLGVSVGPDGLLLIDDQFDYMADKIQAALDGLASDADLDSGSPRFLINTHHHGDHTGGNNVFGEVATVFAHENVRARLVDAGKIKGAGLPSVTYAEGLTIHFNGEEVKLVHLSEGHTDGDTVVYFTGSNVVHMGDHCFNGAFPFIDIDSGGSVKGYLRNIEIVLNETNEETRYIPGHGPLASRKDVQACKRTLEDVVRLVAGALSDGATAESMKADNLLKDYESWGKGFINSERMIDTVVRELTGK